jgi:hypothetical protein
VRDRERGQPPADGITVRPLARGLFQLHRPGTDIGVLFAAATTECCHSTSLRIYSPIR